MAEENEENRNGADDAQEPAEQEGEDITELLIKTKENAQAIEEYKTTIEGYLEELSSLKETAETDSEAVTKAMEESEECKNSASQNAEAVEQAKNSTADLLSKIRAERDDAISLLETIKKHEANAELIADIAEEKDEKVKEYEQQLVGLAEEYAQLKKQIEDLLPGATSASLASAFGARKKGFNRPKIFWACMQVFAVLLLIGIGVWILRNTQIETFSDLFFFVLARSPIIASIVLLEEIARRNRNIALRLEEDYGYKEVLSRSFEGYKKQMAEIAKSEGPVSTLSTNLLDAMAKEPGRLIDIEKPVSVSTPILESALSQINVPEGDSSDGILPRIYEDMKKSIQGNAIKLIVLVILAIAGGIGIGYYLWHNSTP